MPLTRPEIYTLRKQAFKEAADYLEATAKDYDEMASRFPGREQAAERRRLTEQAMLLRGQADHIRRKF